MTEQGNVRDDARSKLLQEHGLLEELNIPPKVIRFIRENAKNLQIGFAALVVVVLAWAAYDYYSEVRRESSSVLLQQALKEEDIAKRVELLQGVVAEYPGSDAAVWSKTELAHADYDGGKFIDAAKKYEEVLNDLSSDNPLTPMVQFSLAQTYEAANEYDKALSAYTRLLTFPGFEGEGYLGQGRMYEKKNDLAHAREAYENLNALPNVSESVKEWAKDKLAKMPITQKAEKTAE